MLIKMKYKNKHRNTMKIFKDTMMSTWDIGLLKTAIAFMAIAIGST